MFGKVIRNKNCQEVLTSCVIKLIIHLCLSDSKLACALSAAPGMQFSFEKVRRLYPAHLQLYLTQIKPIILLQNIRKKNNKESSTMQQFAIALRKLSCVVV